MWIVFVLLMLYNLEKYNNDSVKFEVVQPWLSRYLLFWGVLPE